MKTFLILLLVNLVLASQYAAPAQGQNNQGNEKTTGPKTVTDFYLKLPAKYLPILETIPNRRSLIKIQDLQNGYLRLGSNQWKGWGEVALFKRRNGNALVAVSQYNCGPVCDQKLTFLDYRNGKWTKVEPLPDYTVGDLRTAFHGATGRQPLEDELNAQIFELPRKGRQITLKLNDVAIMGFLWNGNEFVSGMLYLRDAARN